MRIRRMLYLLMLSLLSTAAIGQRADTAAIQVVKAATIRKIPDSVIQSFKKDPDYWYADYVQAEAKKQPGTNSIFTQNWFKILMWILVGAAFLLIAAIYFLSGSVQLFRRSPKFISTPEELDTEGDLLRRDYHQEIESATEAGDFRMAIRLWFLKTLAHLHASGTIQYSPEKTNAEYLMKMASPAREEFSILVRKFDSIWYGHKEVDEHRYREIAARYMAFQKQIS